MAVSPDMFLPAEKQAGSDEAVAGKALGYWPDAWRRLRKHHLAMVGLGLVIFMVLFCFVGPYLAPHDAQHQELELSQQPPNSTYWFGTDQLGRDVFVRVMAGGQISLLVGVLSGVVQLLIGVTYGAIAGFAGGTVDNVMMRIVDIIDTIPLTIYVVLLMVMLGAGLFNLFIAISIFYWTTMARIVRAQILSLKGQEFVLAARVLGAPRKRLIFRHLIPNAMGPIIVTLTLSIPTAIFTEAFLSFLGLGVAPPYASLGSLVASGVKGLRSYPWELLFPAGAIALSMLGFNFLGDGLRDALDPQQRR